ncbi:MAG: hypothetical protein AAB428_00400 [Patescibacteria group bacterium]|mgnify:CR=1 FL=1
MNPIVKNAFVNALATAVYVILISLFLYRAPEIFGQAKTVLVPIVMLMLLVFSAFLTGDADFRTGRPILWYLDGKKREALSLLISTLLVFLTITIVAIIGLTLYFAG